MPYSSYRPELMGTARLLEPGAYEAGSLTCLTLVYTAGQFGIDDAGSIKIGFRFATDFGPVQLTDPAGVGYTTVEASNGATLEARWEFRRNIRPWSRSLYVSVVKDFLAPGELDHDPLRRPPPGLTRHSPPDILRGHLRASRLRRPDCDLRLRRPSRQPVDRHRAGSRAPVAGHRADARTTR